ncbi:MAG: FKBP-type peptidyl-prolyl cis-trans isomerase [Bacteroidetes bacterium]|nr:FKBP-type peptidyl-prolyl cis-trans isomerase [Bacteroidota bacterium]
MKSSISLLMTIVSVFILPGSFSQNIVFPLQNDIDSASYCLGMNVAQQIKSQGMNEINPEKVAAGISAMYNNTDPLILPNEANQYFNNFLQNQKNRIAAENLETGKKFLEENSKKKGVTSLPSGLQYEIIKAGTGQQPVKNDMVTAHYTGMLTDGTVFDSSVQRGQPFQTPVGVGRVIKGWDEALQLMKEGDKWKLYIPPDLGYGANPRPGSGIEPNDVLVFELELIKVEHK